MPRNLNIFPKTGIVYIHFVEDFSQGAIINYRNNSIRMHKYFLPPKKIQLYFQNSYSCFHDEIVRFSDMSLGIWFTQLVLLILLLIVLMTFKDHQPLKSRGVIPFIALTSQFCALFSRSTWYFLNLEWQSKYQCFINLFFYYSMINATSKFYCIMKKYFYCH
jgi:hypothetical protein